MRRLLTLLVLAALAGCGGDDDTDPPATPTEPGPAATDICLGEQGFSLRPSASGVAAISPTGVEFTVTFFDDEAAAEAAAGGAEGSTAVANAVVTPTGKRLTRTELATIEECVRGG